MSSAYVSLAVGMLTVLTASPIYAIQDRPSLGQYLGTDNALYLAGEKVQEGRAVVKGELTFYSPSGQVKTAYPLMKKTPGKSWSTLSKSKNDKYLALNNIADFSNEVIRDGEVIVLDREGQVVWKIKSDLAIVVPSPSSSFILGTRDSSQGNAPLFIYRRDGSVLTIDRDDQPWDADFSPDGSYCAIVVVRSYTNDLGERGVKAVLITLDGNGEIISIVDPVVYGEESFCYVSAHNLEITISTSGAQRRTIIYHTERGRIR